MPAKKSLWTSAKKSMQKSVFCRFCGSDTFALLPSEKGDEIGLECKGCYREYIMQGKAISISDSHGAKKNKQARWDWSKTDWAPS